MDPFLYLSPNGKGLQTCKTKSSLLVLVYFQFTCLLIKGESGECYIDISCGKRRRAQSYLSTSYKNFVSISKEGISMAKRPLLFP